MDNPPWPQGYPCWVDLATTDREASWAFYGDVMGWTMIDTGEAMNHYGIALSGDDRIGAIGEAPGGAAASWSVFFAVDDADATCARVTEHGGAVLLPAGDVGPQGRLAIVEDPTGATFGVWQPYDHPGFGTVRRPGSASWFDLMTADTPTARAFYSAVFDWEYADVGAPFDAYCGVVGVSPSNMIAGIGTIDPADDAGPRWRVYFSVTDVDAVAKQVVDGGGHVFAGPMDSPYGRNIVAADPQGAGVIFIDHSRSAM